MNDNNADTLKTISQENTADSIKQSSSADNKIIREKKDNKSNIETEDTYTLKSINAKIIKLEKKKAINKEKVQQLNKEINSCNEQIIELEKIYDKLYKEDIQRQLETKWFKESKMTGEDVAKFINELGKKLYRTINILDIDEIVEAVSLVHNEKSENNKGA